MPKEPHVIPKEPPVTEPPVKDPQPYRDPQPAPQVPEPGTDVPLTDPTPPAPTMERRRVHFGDRAELRGRAGVLAGNAEGL
jgi:hypothetical protein